MLLYPKQNIIVIYKLIETYKGETKLKVQKAVPFADSCLFFSVSFSIIFIIDYYLRFLLLLFISSFCYLA